jgi:hypothetical protein
VCGLLTPVIDNWSHVGGLLYGALCALSTIEPLAVGFFGVHTSTWSKVRTIAIKYGGLIVSLVLILVSTMTLATMPDPTESPCSGCRYISCIPMPPFKDDKWWYCDDCDFVTAVDLTKQGTIYSGINLTCPNDEILAIDISSDALSDRNDVGRRLPTYCRDHCDSRFN